MASTSQGRGERENRSCSSFLSAQKLATRKRVWFESHAERTLEKEGGECPETTSLSAATAARHFSIFLSSHFSVHGECVHAILCCKANKERWVTAQSATKKNTVAQLSSDDGNREWAIAIGD